MKEELKEAPVQNREFSACISKHQCEMSAQYRKPEFLRLITALFGYDITKGLTSSTSNEKIYWTIMERFRDSENDKVVLATIGSTLQICTTLATTPKNDETGKCEKFDFARFCGFVKRLYCCDLRGYDYGEIGDFRYHVMSYLKGRSAMERGECDGIVPPQQ